MTYDLIHDFWSSLCGFHRRLNWHSKSWDLSFNLFRLQTMIPRIVLFQILIPRMTRSSDYWVKTIFAMLKWWNSAFAKLTGSIFSEGGGRNFDFVWKSFWRPDSRTYLTRALSGILSPDDLTRARESGHPLLYFLDGESQVSFCSTAVSILDSNTQQCYSPCGDNYEARNTEFWVTASGALEHNSPSRVKHTD